MSRSATAPSDRSRPAPPSVVALPPIPSTIEPTPASSAARIRSPVPAEVAAAASRSDAATRESPDAVAISITARVPSSDRSQRAWIGRDSGSATVASCQVQPPAAATASRVPSPPSASGQSRIVSAGRARVQPAASARATSTEVSEPLNESGAIRMVRGRTTAVTVRSDAPAVRPLPGQARARSAPARRRADVARGIPGSGSSAAAPGRPAR